MFFKVSNKEMQFGIVCGVQEFSAPPGICHVPYHIMNNIGVKEGSQVEIEKNLSSAGKIYETASS